MHHMLIYYAYARTEEIYHAFTDNPIEIELKPPSHYTPVASRHGAFHG